MYCKNKKKTKFTFHEVDNEKIVKEIKRLNINRTIQKSNIPIAIIHENCNIFTDFLAESLKGTIKTYNFPNYLKLVNITPMHKKGEYAITKTIGWLIFYQRCLKY